MTSSSTITKLPYQRLIDEGGFELDDYGEDREKVGVVNITSRNYYRYKRVVPLRRRFRVRVPSLRRFLKRKASKVRFRISQVFKRLKEGQAHFGDLFAGNYLFMQVNPTTLKCVQKSFQGQNGYNGLKFSLPE